MRTGDVCRRLIAGGSCLDKAGVGVRSGDVRRGLIAGGSYLCKAGIGVRSGDVRRGLIAGGSEGDTETIAFIAIIEL